MFQTNVVEKIKTHIFYSVTFFEYRVVYEIMWKNNLEAGRPQMAVCCMCIACWISEATNTHSGCVIRIAFPQRQRLHERASVLRYNYIASLALYLFLSVFGSANCLFHLPHFIRTVPEIFTPVDVVVCSPLLSSVMVFE